MKKFFKFAAMALAAVVMAGGAVSCDPDENNDDQKLTLDGKVLKIEVENMGVVYLDLGVFAPGNLTMGMAMYESQGDNTIYAINPLGSYTITATDETSGKIIRQVESFTENEETGIEAVTVSQEIPYSNLTATSCTISMNWLGMMDVTATAEIVSATLVGNQGGNDYPTPDGKQWVLEDPAFGGSMGYFYDFGYTEEYVLYEGYLQLSDYSPVSPAPADYMFEAIDETSGILIVAGGAYYPEDGVEYQYKDLTEESVKIEATLYDTTAEAGTFVELTLASQPIEWEMEPATEE